MMKLTYVNHVMMIGVLSGTLAIGSNATTQQLIPTPVATSSAQAQAAVNPTLILLNGQKVNDSTLEQLSLIPNQGKFQISQLSTHALVDTHTDNVIRSGLNMNQGSQYAYVVQGPTQLYGGTYGVNFTDPAQVIQIDTLTGQTKTLYEQAALFGTSISPDEQKAVLLGAHTIREPFTTFCVLTIATGKCQSVSSLGAVDTDGWIDNSRFFYTDQNNLYILDTNSLQARTAIDVSQLPGGATDATLLPGTRSMVIASYQPPLTGHSCCRADKLLTYDVDTQNLIPMPFDLSADTGLTLEVNGAGNLRASPNGRYIEYTAYDFSKPGPDHVYFLVVDLRTGKAVVNIKQRIFALWQQDSLHLIGVRQIPNMQNYEIAQFDLAGNSFHVADFSSDMHFNVQG